MRSSSRAFVVAVATPRDVSPSGTWRPCRAVALAIVGDVAAAEDMAQDAVVYAIERIDDCRQPDRFGAWLLRIVRNRSRNYVRDRKSDRPCRSRWSPVG
jgi:RNA polymerase sigma factor (sigma-70 family)